MDILNINVNDQGAPQVDDKCSDYLQASSLFTSKYQFSRES